MHNLTFLRTGLINPIGEWVLQQTCDDIKTWKIAGFSGFKVAVNLSLRQLQAGKLFEKVSAILQQTGVDGKKSAFECDCRRCGNA